MIAPNGSAKFVTSGRLPNISSDDTSMASSVSTSTEKGTGSHIPEISKADSNESKKKYIDEGTLCLNMIISRLFFDAKNNLQLKSSLHNAIQVAIRETLVLPNSEYIILPWMLAEKDDWIPGKAAPFMWYKNNQDSTGKQSKREESSFQPGELAHNVESSHGNSTRSEVEDDMSKNVGPIPEVTGESVGPCATSSSLMDESVSNISSFQELRAPLVKNEKMQESIRRSIEPRENTCMVSPSRFSTKSEDDDTMLRRMGTKERMRGLGKKMGEKLEVKRRNIKEKGRSFVERMKGP